jgi:succinoglycan biosynthesis protein ExoA
MLRRYPDTLRWRQGLPPLFVLSLVGLGILGTFTPLFRVLLGAELGIYIIVLAATGVQSALHKRQISLIFGLPLAISVMHICWGSGFLWSMIKGVFSNHEPERK